MTQDVDVELEAESEEEAEKLVRQGFYCNPTVGPKLVDTYIGYDVRPIDSDDQEDVYGY